MTEAPTEKPKRTRKKTEASAESAPIAEKPKRTRKKAEAPAESAPAAEKTKRTRRKKAEESAE